PVWGVIQLTSVALASFGRERESLKRRAITAAIFTVLSLLLVPRLAGVGSAIAYVGAMFLESVFLLVALRQSAPGLFGAMGLFRLLTANGAMAALVLAVSSLPSLARVALGALTYGIAALVTGLVPLSELRALRRTRPA